MIDRFIIVPAVTLPSGTLVPSFQVGQYACGRGEDGKAIVTPEAAPWGPTKACVWWCWRPDGERNGSGYALIRGGC